MEVRVSTITIGDKTYVSSSEVAAVFYIEHEQIMYAIEVLKDNIVDFEDWIYEVTYNPYDDLNFEMYYMAPEGAKFVASQLGNIVTLPCI